MSKQVSKASQVVSKTITRLREGAEQLFNTTKKGVEKGVRKLKDWFFSGEDSFETYNNDNKGRNLIMSNHQANEKAFVAARSSNNSAAMRRKASSGAPSMPQRSVESQSPAQDANVHTVKRGDTLSQIARNHGTSVDALVKQNGIENPDLIFPGQKIQIPENAQRPSAAQRPTAAQTPARTETPAAPTGSNQYVVKAGDTLSEIGQRLGVNWRELAKTNNISNPNRIFPGQVLNLPQGHAAPTQPANPTNQTTPAHQPTPVAPIPGQTAGPEANQRALNIALGEEGVREDAGRDQDRAGRITEYRQAVSGPGYSANRGPEPWCADFVSWAYKQAGKPLGPEGKGFAYVPYMKNWLQESGQWHDKNSGYTPKPGDIVVFDWDGGQPDHVGMVESVNRDGTINTIEGNASNAVKRLTRNPSTIEGYGSLR